MAWEWVAPLGTTAVGIAGIAATYWTGKRQRQSQVDGTITQYKLGLAAENNKAKAILFAAVLSEMERISITASVYQKIEAIVRSPPSREEVLRRLETPELERLLRPLLPDDAPEEARENLYEIIVKQATEESKSSLDNRVQSGLAVIGLEGTTSYPGSEIIALATKTAELTLIASIEVANLARDIVRRLAPNSPPTDVDEQRDALQNDIHKLRGLMRKELSREA